MRVGGRVRRGTIGSTYLIITIVKIEIIPNSNNVIQSVYYIII